MLAKNLPNLHYFDFGKNNHKVTREAQISTFPEGIPQMEILSATESANFTSAHIITNPVKTIKPNCTILGSIGT